jgi:hypothetical protein
MTTLARRFFWILAATALVPALQAQTPEASRPIFRYQEGKYGSGQLKYHGKTPILVVEGTPEEIGKQIGHLQVNVVGDFQKLIERYVAHRGWAEAYPWLIRTGGLLAYNFPADHRKEFEAAAKEAKLDRDFLVLINTAFDVVSMFACSTMIVEPERSATGAIVFGRNLDLPPFAYLHELTMVTVYRPKGKHAFASVGFPGVMGVISGMNDAGLSLAVNEIIQSKDGAAKFNPLGTPKLLLLRRVLEECTTLDEAEKLLKSSTRTGMIAVTMADKNGGAVFEVTPKSVVRRSPTQGLCCCTNDFRTAELGLPCHCPRWDALEKSRTAKKLTLDDVNHHLHEARFPDMTIQTMIFEPTRLRLHLAFGRIPSSNLPRETLELEPLFTTK